MLLSKLTLLNFKNIPQAQIEFCPRLNCLVGDNAAGKTNVIDAVYYLSMCKSAFNMTDGQNVTHGQDFFMIEGEYTSVQGRDEKILCSFKRGGTKVVKRGGKEYEKLSQHIGTVPIVMVSPGDTSLITDSGEERRRYLNSFISQMESQYLANLVKYNHLLSERNKLLKQPDSSGFSQVLEILDMQIAPLGQAIYECREKFTAQISELVAQHYAVLSDDREEVELVYRSELRDRSFAELLGESQHKDIVNGYTTSGVHRDDLVMKIGGHNLRKYGSQGQQKSYLIALKLAQYDILSSLHGEFPILLLDDIFDKLDVSRVGRLLSIVATQRFGQIFITDCNKLRLQTILDNSGLHYSLFQVADGVIESAQQA